MLVATALVNSYVENNHIQSWKLYQVYCITIQEFVDCAVGYTLHNITATSIK